MHEKTQSQAIRNHIRNLAFADTHEINPLELIYRFRLTQAELSELVGVSLSAVAKWSSGKRKPSRQSRREAYRAWEKLMSLEQSYKKS